MQIQLQQINPNDDNDYKLVNRIAKGLCEIYDGKENIEKKYSGIFTLPYRKYVEENPQLLQAAEGRFDENIDGQPHSYGWRWWGKTAEKLLTALENDVNVSLKENSNEIL